MLRRLQQRLAAVRSRRRSSDKLLFRLLSLSVQHAETLAILLYVCGTVGLLASPLLSVPARSMETALLAGQADATIRWVASYGITTALHPSKLCLLEHS